MEKVEQRLLQFERWKYLGESFSSEECVWHMKH
jgi:hypothetical protein